MPAASHYLGLALAWGRGAGYLNATGHRTTMIARPRRSHRGALCQPIMPIQDGAGADDLCCCRVAARGEERAT